MSDLVDLSWSHDRLDSIGIAGFSHNFGCLEGENPPVAQVFEEFATMKPTFITISIVLLAQLFPILWSIPTKRRRLTQAFNRSVEEIAKKLLEETRKEKAGLSGKEEKSLIGLLSMLVLSPPGASRSLRLLYQQSKQRAMTPSFI